MTTTELKKETSKETFIFCKNCGSVLIVGNNSRHPNQKTCTPCKNLPKEKKPRNKKDPALTAYSTLRQTVRVMYVSWFVYLEDSEKSSQDITVKAFCSIFKNAFYNPLDPIHFIYFGIDNRSGRDKYWIIDEIFGRTNLVKQVVLRILKGYTVEQIIVDIEKFLIKCDLPITKFNVMNDNGETVCKSLNMIMIDRLQKKYSGDVIWGSDIIDSYKKDYREICLEYGFDPFI